MGYFLRGPRYSALAGFDHKGFVAWHIVKGSFNEERFLEAVKAIVLPHMNPFPGKRSVVILDNASIHHSARFTKLIHAAGGMVLYTPPYCWNLTPLDNGAFGALKQWLQRYGEWVGQVGMVVGLDRAFHCCVGKRAARSFLAKCGYTI